MPEYAVVKFAPYKDELMNTTGATDIPLMRFEEMLLIKAEGLAMEGQWTDAKTLIENFVNDYRWTDESARYTCSAQKAFSDVPFYVSYSRNHLKVKDGKKARPKFHIYFPVDKIINGDEYGGLKQKVCKYFPKFDIAEK